jgi:hypothetical protein
MALRVAAGRARLHISRGAMAARVVYYFSRRTHIVSARPNDLRWTRRATIPRSALGTRVGDQDGDDELQLWLPEVGSSSAVFDPSPATWSTLKAVTKLGRAGEWRGKRGIDWGTGRDRRVYRFSRVFVSSVRSAS